MNSKYNNKLLSKTECPHCHFNFIVGYNNNDYIKCPECRHQFNENAIINHGNACNICNSRNRGLDNIYYNDGCPAIMNDSRFATYYNSTNELTESMRKLNGFKNTNQFRNFMQNNSDAFIKAERDFYYNKSNCNPNIACSQGWFDLWTNYGGNWHESCVNNGN